LEKDLQNVTEKNLDVIFGLKFISSEFALQNFRIDSLAFDEETKSFVIIEYKRDRSFSIVDQGFSYLSLMLNNKADFLLEYNENMKSNLKRGDIDWSQSRVLFLAGSFTAYQQNAINFKDLPIELWEVKKYSNDIILYNQIKPPKTNESIGKISKRNSLIQNVSKEVKKCTINDHFGKDWDNSRKLFEELRERILEIDNRIEEIPVKYYIGYKIGGLLLINLKIRKSKIIINLSKVQPKDMKDPEKRIEYIENSIKYWGQHESRFDVKGKQDVDYAFFLIKQLHEKFYSK